MTDESNEPFALDIGVGSAGRAVETRRLRRDETSDQTSLHITRSVRQRRSLPRWALIGLALLAGWVLGTVMTTSSASQNAGDDSLPEPTTMPSVAIPSVPEPLLPAPGEQVEPTSGDSRVTVVMVQAPLRGVAIPADITVIEDGISTRVDVDGELIAGVSQGVVGQGDRRMLVVGDQVVFMAFDKVMVLDPSTKAQPTEIGRAIYLLAGSDEGHVWAIGSGSHTATLIDIDNPDTQLTYSLTDVGAPLGSLRSGIVVAPADPELGKVAVWSPRLGVQPIGIDADLQHEFSFIDAAGNDLVLATPAGLASFNVVTGILTQTAFQISASEEHRAFVSPDGSRLAIAKRGPITALPRVVVVDVDTGQTIDEFETAFEWQLQWVSNHDVLFMSPLADAVAVKLRDTSTGTTTSITELVGPNFWVAIAS